MTAVLKRISARVRTEESGFTLVELLVVIVVIGILAAIALAVFLGQSRAADDADAKSNVRNLQAEVETCQVQASNFALCDGVGAGDQLPTNLGLAIGSSPGQVRVANATQESYEVVAVSKARSAGSNHSFTLSRDPTGQVQRTCFAGPSNSDGGCRGGFWSP